MSRHEGRFRLSILMWVWLVPGYASASPSLNFGWVSKQIIWTAGHTSILTKFTKPSLHHVLKGNLLIMVKTVPGRDHHRRTHFLLLLSCRLLLQWLVRLGHLHEGPHLKLDCTFQILRKKIHSRYTINAEYGTQWCKFQFKAWVPGISCIWTLGACCTIFKCVCIDSMIDSKYWRLLAFSFLVTKKSLKYS